MIAEAEVNDQISSTEAGYLNEIIEVARNDQWQLMVDQVQY